MTVEQYIFHIVNGWDVNNFLPLPYWILYTILEACLNTEQLRTTKDVFYIYRHFLAGRVSAVDYHANVVNYDKFNQELLALVRQMGLQLIDLSLRHETTSRIWATPNTMLLNEFDNSKMNYNTANENNNTIPDHRRYQNRIVVSPDTNMILLVESKGAMSNYKNINLHKILGKTIVVAISGMIENGTVAFVRWLSQKFHLPVVALLDCDASGFRCFLRMKYGNPVYRAVNLYIPWIFWGGIFGSQLRLLPYNGPGGMLPMTPFQRQAMENLQGDENLAIITPENERIFDELVFSTENGEHCSISYLAPVEFFRDVFRRMIMGEPIDDEGTMWQLLGGPTPDVE